MSSDSATREASHREDESAGPIQNVAACETLTTHPSTRAVPPSPSDSKRSNAAQLARQLGSSSPWSETLIPQRYGTPQSSTNTSTEPTLADRQESANILNHTSPPEQDLDPPPAYSRAAPNNLYQARDTPPAGMDTQNSTAPVPNNADVSQPLLSTNAEHVPGTQQAEPDVETPLLARPSSTHGGRRWSRWMQRRKVRRQRARRFLFVFFFFCVVVSVLVGFLVGHHHGVRSPSPVEPLADTCRPLGSVVRPQGTVNPS